MYNSSCLIFMDDLYKTIPIQEVSKHHDEYIYKLLSGAVIYIYLVNIKKWVEFTKINEAPSYGWQKIEENNVPKRHRAIATLY